MLAVVPTRVRRISSKIKLVVPPADTENIWLYTDVACVNQALPEQVMDESRHREVPQSVVPAGQSVFQQIFFSDV